MIIPFRTNRPSPRRPIITEFLIFMNLAVFTTMLVGERLSWWTRDSFTDAGMLGPESGLQTFLTYQFLHDPHGIMHLGMNMLFLWVFGGAVEGRLGRVVFLAFYLIGGVVAGFGHTLTSDAPVIGASGAVCAVTGAFIALFPRSRIDIFVFFLLIGIFSVRATLVIGVYIGLDILGVIFDWSNVAYSAHLAGYAYGFGIGFALLALRILPREEFDVFFLYTQWRRRRAFRRASGKQVGGLYESASADTGERLARKNRKRTNEPSEATSALRSQIASAHREGNLDDATRLYLDLLNQEPDACLGEAQQADIANHLASQSRDQDASRAYEALVQRFPNRNSSDEIRLMLAMLYTRRLGQPDRARAHLDAVGDRLRDASQRDFASTLRAELGMDESS